MSVSLTVPFLESSAVPPASAWSDGQRPFRPASPAILAFATAIAAACPGSRIDVGPTSLTVAASRPNGFPVSIEESEDGFVVYLGPCTTEVSSNDVALQLVIDACAGRSALTVEHFRGKVRQWTLAKADGPLTARIIAQGGQGCLLPWRRQTRVLSNCRHAS